MRKTFLFAAICTGGLAGAASAQTGACCFVGPTGGGICAVVSADQCADLGGTYQGDDTTCDTTACPDAPTGACCIAFGPRDCIEVTEGVCGVLGGTYQGDDTTCDTANCAPPPGPCACDVDADGDADVHDLLAFIDDWFAGTGDFDADGDTDVHDLLAFINCFVRGC